MTDWNRPLIRHTWEAVTTGGWCGAINVARKCPTCCSLVDDSEHDVAVHQEWHDRIAMRESL